MYAGADAVTENIVDKSDDVVNLLISNLLGYGYHMYNDSYYTFIHLAISLYTHSTYLIGTTKSNRIVLPETETKVCKRKAIL